MLSNSRLTKTDLKSVSKLICNEKPPTIFLLQLFQSHFNKAIPSHLTSYPHKHYHAMETRTSFFVQSRCFLLPPSSSTMTPPLTCSDYPHLERHDQIAVRVPAVGADHVCGLRSESPGHLLQTGSSRHGAPAQGGRQAQEAPAGRRQLTQLKHRVAALRVTDLGMWGDKGG